MPIDERPGKTLVHADGGLATSTVADAQGAYTSLAILAVALWIALLSAACGDDESICTSDADCAQGEHCVSLDPDPTDNVLYAKSCVPECSVLSPGDCSSGCCAQVDGQQVCAPRDFCGG